MRVSQCKAEKCEDRNGIHSNVGSVCSIALDAHTIPARSTGCQDCCVVCAHDELIARDRHKTQGLRRRLVNVVAMDDKLSKCKGLGEVRTITDTLPLVGSAIASKLKAE